MPPETVVEYLTSTTAAFSDKERACLPHFTTITQKEVTGTLWAAKALAECTKDPQGEPMNWQSR